MLPVALLLLSVAVSASSSVSGVSAATVDTSFSINTPFFRNFYSGLFVPDSQTRSDGITCEVGGLIEAGTNNLGLFVPPTDNNYNGILADVSCQLLTNGVASPAIFPQLNYGLNSLRGQITIDANSYTNLNTLPSYDFQFQCTSAPLGQTVTSPDFVYTPTCKGVGTPDSLQAVNTATLNQFGQECITNFNIHSPVAGITVNGVTTQPISKQIINPLTGVAYPGGSCAFPTVVDINTINCSFQLDPNSVPVNGDQLNVPVAIQVTYADGTTSTSPAANYYAQCAVQSSSVIGDPQFTGFMNQQYQVHGAADTVYNIISTPSMQYNAYFRFLNSGKCRKGTACFSHAGNYFGSVGLLVKDESRHSEVTIESGDVATGLSVQINNATLPIPSTKVQLGAGYSLEVINPFEVVVESDEFNFRITNSDQFLNQDVSIGSALLQRIQAVKKLIKSGNVEEAASLESTLPHGVLGQTWKQAQYDNRWKYIQGQLFDYVVEDGIHGKQFKYNRF